MNDQTKHNSKQLILTRPELNFNILTASARSLHESLTREEQLNYVIERPDIEQVAQSFTPPLSPTEVETLTKWVTYVFDQNKPATPASLVFVRAVSILHVDVDSEKYTPHVDEDKRRSYFIHNNKIDADLTTLSGVGYINEFNEMADADPDLISVFFHSWEEWSAGTLENTLRLLMHSEHLHKVSNKHVEIIQRHLPTTTDVGVKDAILDLCSSLQEDFRFDMSWLLDLELTPQWIKDYAIIIGTRNTSLHPQKDAE